MGYVIGKWWIRELVVLVILIFEVGCEYVGVWFSIFYVIILMSVVMDWYGSWGGRGLS